MHSTGINLRERNRREAWTAIHNAAAELALENGLALTTVEMIVSAAGVSQRTFFNYFPSKEDAVLGVRALTLPESALAAFHEPGTDMLGRTVQLMAAVIRTAIPDDGLLERRLTLIRSTPELRARLAGFSASAEALIEPVLAAEFSRRHAAGAVASQQEVHDSAKALLMLAGTIIRFAYTKDPAAASAKDSAGLTAAITTFREVTRNSS